MNQLPQEDWYYLRGEEPEGPISFEELKAKVGDLMLQPPLEMVWTEGMDDWTPFAEIEGLCETVGTQHARATGAPANDEWFYAMKKAEAEEETRVKAAEEAKLRAAAEANIATEFDTVEEEEEARVAAEAKAAEDARVAAEKIKAAAAAIAKAESEAAEAKTGKKQKRPSVPTKNVWFYTCEGDRLGPVSFEELRDMASATSLNPRLDMVWKQGMDEWKPAGQIDGLFERRSVPAGTKETLAPSADPFPPPPLQNSLAVMGKNAVWPGARRRSFLLASLVFPFAWAFALSAISPFLDNQFGKNLMETILSVAAFAPLVVLVYFGLKRLRNLGMSRWWGLAFFAPILNIWVGFRCFACPAGYAYHKKMDGPGIALAILYSLMILLIVLILAALIAIIFGAIESPELKKLLSATISWL